VFKYTLEDMGFITEAQSQTLFSSIEELEALNKNQVFAIPLTANLGLLLFF